MATGFGTISRAGKAISIHCAQGTLAVRTLKLSMAASGARAGGKALAAKATRSGEGVTLEFASPVSLSAGQTLTVA
jgi:hypothetical protein